MKIIDSMFGNRPTRLIMPDDYATGAPMALLLFTAGAGEHPDSPSLATLDLLYNNNAALTRARDGGLNNVIDPVTGKSYRFAVASMQGRSRIPAQPDEVAAYTAQIISAYNIDRARVYKTGLSAGGDLTIRTLAGTMGSTFAAGVPMSTPGFTVPDWQNNLKGKMLAFHGTADTGITDYQNSVLAVNGANAAHSGFASLISVPGGHGNWDLNYDPAAKFIIPGFGLKLSIYEFMLLCSSSPSFKFTSSGTVAGINGVVPVNLPTKAISNCTVDMTNGAVVLDASKSTGQIGSFAFQVTPPAGAPMPQFQRMDGGADLAPINGVGGKSAGKWAFKLTVWDKYGGSDSTIQTLDTSGAVVVPPVVIPPVVNPPVVNVVKEIARFDVVAHVVVYSDGSKIITYS